MGQGRPGVPNRACALDGGRKNRGPGGFRSYAGEKKAVGRRGRRRPCPELGGDGRRQRGRDGPSRGRNCVRSDSRWRGPRSESAGSPARRRPAWRPDRQSTRGWGTGWAAARVRWRLRSTCRWYSVRGGVRGAAGGFGMRSWPHAGSHSCGSPSCSSLKQGTGTRKTRASGKGTGAPAKTGELENLANYRNIELFGLSN